MKRRVDALFKIILQAFNCNGASTRYSKPDEGIQLKLRVGVLFKEALGNSIAKWRVEEIKLKQRVDALFKEALRNSIAKRRVEEIQLKRRVDALVKTAIETVRRRAVSMEAALRRISILTARRRAIQRRIRELIENGATTRLFK